MTIRFDRTFFRAMALPLLLALAGTAFAQSTATVTVMENEGLGTYLTDAEGRTLYLFVNEDMESEAMGAVTEGVRSNAAPCAGGCLEAWPPLAADAVEAGEGVNPDLLYVADVDGTMQVVYNGWPLYYFASDTQPGDVAGQGLGGGANKWYVVDAEGNAVRAGGEM